MERCGWYLDPSPRVSKVFQCQVDTVRMATHTVEGIDPLDVSRRDSAPASGRCRLSPLPLPPQLANRTDRQRQLSSASWHQARSAPMDWFWKAAGSVLSCGFGGVACQNSEQLRRGNGGESRARLFRSCSPAGDEH